MLNLKLEELIKTSKEPRELKRALAVKMIMSGLKVKEIEGILQVSDSFISKWKLIYEKQGTSGLRLKYQGKKSYLDEKEISAPLQAKYAAMGIEELKVADVESAYTSSAMMKKILFDKKQQIRRRKKNDK